MPLDEPGEPALASWLALLLLGDGGGERPIGVTTAVPWTTETKRKRSKGSSPDDGSGGAAAAGAPASVEKLSSGGCIPKLDGSKHDGPAFAEEMVRVGLADKRAASETT
eukprot:3929354-Prymnesium_polylepis.1